VALVECPDCGRQVSDQAVACIGCGRPLLAPEQPPEVCEVVLKQISRGGAMFGDPRWILVAQVMTPTGIKVAASREYKSKNYLAEYQGEYRQFQDARQDITNELLRDGWEPLASTPGPGAVTLPRFQRRVTPNGQSQGSAGEPETDRGPSMERSMRTSQAASEAENVLLDFLDTGLWKIVDTRPGVIEAKWGRSDGQRLTVTLHDLGPQGAEIALVSWMPEDVVAKLGSGKVIQWALQRDLKSVLDKFEKEAPLG
jgi:hypothetical protein